MTGASTAALETVSGYIDDPKRTPSFSVVPSLTGALG